MRAHREPSDGAEAESDARTETYEGYKCRRPQRTISGINRSRPPAPSILIEKPASVMIRGPAPGLVRHPRPAIVPFPNPSSSLVRRPRCRLLIRLPNVPISRDINPVAVTIQVGSAGVISVRPSWAVSFFNYAVTIPIPFVP